MDEMMRELYDYYFPENEEVYKIFKDKKLKCFPYANKFDGGIYKAAIFAGLDAIKFSMMKDWHLQNVKRLSRKKSNMKFKTFSKIKIGRDYIVLPKIGKIKVFEKDYLPTSEIFEEVSLTHDGNDWYVVVFSREDNPQTLTWRGVDNLQILKNYSSDSISCIDSRNNIITVNGEEILDVTYSSRYLKVEKRLKGLNKKLVRQTKSANQSLAPSRHKNIAKTKLKASKLMVRLENIKKDYFKKTAHNIVERQKATNKPIVACVLDSSSISRTRNNFSTRKQKRSGTGHFFNVLQRKFESSGARVLHLSSDEFKTTLGSRGSQVCGEVVSPTLGTKAVLCEAEITYGKEQMNLKNGVSETKVATEDNNTKKSKV